MKLKALVAALSAASVLIACGGGGSDAGTSPFDPDSGSGSGSDNGSGGATTGPTIAVVLADSVGASTAYTVAGQTYTFKVVLKDASGAVVAGKAVTAQAPDFTFVTPTNGSALTDQTGTASFTVTQTSTSVSGASQICATAKVASTELAQCADVQMGAVSASLGSVTTSATTVAAYQSIQVSVQATLTGITPAVGVPISYGVSCGTLSASTVNTDSTGVAKVTYTNEKSEGGACEGNVTITATTSGSAAASGSITAVAPVASNIQFVGATPPRIYLQGVPGSSSSIVKFKLLDGNGSPIANRQVLLDFALRPAGASLRVAGNLEETLETNTQGEVSVSVLSGTAPGPVQVRARLVGNLGISNVSNGLSIASGLPTQDRFSLSVSTFNIEGLEVDGVLSTLTVRAADRLGNPVPDGTAINFISSGGQVVGNCLTTGTAIDEIAGCSVKFSSQESRPDNGRVTVLAWAQGEESFTDLSEPQNNVFDPGVDTYTNMGQPYLDADFNGAYDATKGDQQVGEASGSSTCSNEGALPLGAKSIDSSCSQDWGRALVRKSAVIVLSGSRPDLSLLMGSVAAGPGENTCAYTFALKDVNGNPMPAGTKLSVVSVSGGAFSVFSGEGDTVPNTNDSTRTTHVANFTGCASPAALSFSLKVETPRGIATTFALPTSP